MITDEMLARATYEVDMAILKQLPDPSECKHVFSESFEKKMAKLLRRAKHYAAYKFMERAACILITFLISASMVLAFNTEARAAFLSWVEEHFDGFYHYFFIGEETPAEHQSYRPGWLPDGYTLLDSFVANNSETIIYIGSNGELMRFTCMYGSDEHSHLLGIGQYEHKYVSIDGFNAELYLSSIVGEANGITWQSEDGCVLFTISGDLPETVLLKIAQSVIAQEKN